MSPILDNIYCIVRPGAFDYYSWKFERDENIKVFYITNNFMKKTYNKLTDFYPYYINGMIKLLEKL